MLSCFSFFSTVDAITVDQFNMSLNKRHETLISAASFQCLQLLKLAEKLNTCAGPGSRKVILHRQKLVQRQLEFIHLQIDQLHKMRLDYEKALDTQSAYEAHAMAVEAFKALDLKNDLITYMTISDLYAENAYTFFARPEIETTEHIFPVCPNHLLATFTPIEQVADPKLSTMV